MALKSIRLYIFKTDFQRSINALLLAWFKY